MIEFIEAVLPPTDQPTFDSPEEAIAHGERAFVDITLGGQSIGDCIGQTIERVDWSDAAFRLHLNNGLALTLHLHDREIDAAVTREPSPFDLGDNLIAERVVVRLATQEFVWDRAMLMHSLVGKAAVRLQLSGSDAANFLYVKGIGILYLCALIDRSSQRAFMFWSPSD